MLYYNITLFDAMSQKIMTITKLSASNLKVLALLQRAAKPLSAYDILDKLRRHGLRSPPTVYRALDYLTKHGLAHRIESLNAFVACHHHHDDHYEHMSQFAICTACGQVQEIEDEVLPRALSKLNQQFLKQVHHKVLEISGICGDCSGGA